MDDGPVVDLHVAWPLLQREGLLNGLATEAAPDILKLIAWDTRALEVEQAVASALPRLGLARVAPDALQLLAPIPRTPKNVFCLGRNYVDHIQEDNASRDKATPLPEAPQFFTKPATAITGPHADIELDSAVTRRLDYEVELAFVIGRGGRDIPAKDAWRHVFGYTIVNDVTARDLQRRHDQWFKGKGLDTFCPMGPWIVHASRVPDPHALRIELDVNGERRQDASTADMIFKIPAIIESLSAGMTLEPGDVVATGTPSGVGYAMNPRRFLAEGDVVTCRIEGLGELTNRVRGVN
ncbi:fumarylacetoacetate hydrolase family protein [Hydrogenophaga sp. BPS33]|nr:fumarylacetoacetate hydrolase family protein [Hydrogenophaga sp. BPS33]